MEDGKINGVHEDPESFLYFPFPQSPSGDLTLLLETAGESGPATEAIRHLLVTEPDAPFWVSSPSGSCCGTRCTGCGYRRCW